MDDPAQYFMKNRKLNPKKLLSYGFIADREGFRYEMSLPGSGFLLRVRVTAQGRVSAQVLDPASGEPYVLHLAKGACGSFVGDVRQQYENILTDIAGQCFEPEQFQAAQSKEIISFVRETYGDELEFLWPKSPGNAIWRRKDTQKWYAALLTVSREKLGFSSSEKAEILDLRCLPEDLDGLLRRKGYFPGYHMNKKSWYTIVLDGSVPTEEISGRLRQSYALALK